MENENKENTISYVYEIEFLPTGKRYIGSRTAKGCHPDELLKTYFTSSKIVNNLIKEYGVESFRVVYIDVLNSDDFGDYTARDAESWLLKEFEAGTDENYLNLHENDLDVNLKKYCEFHGIENPMQLDEIKEKTKNTWMRNYRVDHPLQSPVVQEKQKQTNLEKLGYENPLQSPVVQEKWKQTNLEKYGYEYPSQSPVVQEKQKQTNLEKYGYEYSLQSPEVRERIKQTNLEKLGYEYPSQSPVVQEKWKQTNLEKYGYENPLQSPVVQEKQKQTNLERLGVENPFQSPEVKERIKQTNLEKYGVENISKIKLKCPHCEHITSYNQMGIHFKKQHPEHLAHYIELKKKGHHLDALIVKNES